MSDVKRGFADVVRRGDAEPPQPVDAYLAELDRLIDAHDYFRRDKVIPAIGRGTASRDTVHRVALELYYLGRWMTPDFAVLIANAPDGYAFTMEDSAHYHHWAQNFADETGYLRDPNHVQMKVDFCRQLGLGDDDIRAYVPLPETIAMTFTMLYYVRRGYEEGLAVFGYAGERVAAGSGYARTLYEGLRTHYGVDVRNFAVHAYAEPDHGAKAADLFRRVAITKAVQDRCRTAIRNTLLVAEARVAAMNRWVE
ncbi:MAG TPA: iron-containing redox enzyme family protein [Candidatus Binatia bacterium]|nr:iron-containing redox enzyme family protein [Candidatus Binatia bacterium]